MNAPEERYKFLKSVYIRMNEIIRMKKTYEFFALPFLRCTLTMIIMYEGVSTPQPVGLSLFYSSSWSA
jgi:hypothetical protein